MSLPAEIYVGTENVPSEVFPLTFVLEAVSTVWERADSQDDFDLTTSMDYAEYSVWENQLIGSWGDSMFAFQTLLKGCLD